MTASEVGKDSSKKKITVVTPVYNEEACINYFYNRCRKATDPLLERYDIEFLFVNNGSTDRTLAIIRDLNRNDHRVRLITHSRNFGYQASVLCGLTHAAGDALVIIDVDCEDPPEMITEFVRHWEQGYDIVYGERGARPEFFLLVWARKLFYRLTRLIADWEFVLDMAEFSLFTDRVRREILRNRSTFPFVRSDLGYVGFRRHGIAYHRESRAFGETHYSLIRMTQFAIGGILTASTFPLRLVVYLAVPLMAVDLIWSITTFFPPKLPLDTLIASNLTFFVGAVAALAMYLSRVYKDSARRPIFIVDKENSIFPEPPSMLDRTQGNAT